MTELERIAQELEAAHGGHPWHGPSRASVLADITVEEAARRPSPNGHSIWALVLHMRAWTGEVARRLREGDAREPVDGDWPVPPTPSAQAWRATIAGLEEAHREVMAAVKASAPARLDERGGSGDPSLGATTTYRVMLHGLAQHDAYHTGQISLLKRIYRDGVS
ncbi:MAG: DinB family protein [Gemmatimonadaceae bacterium]|nr:DinB family protein [Gemmatimonadaceae bacterium]NUO95239.1 DinB family protein [Gemmatimonadaceae bacterium]NUP54244.1 DinB family protein [Gemmatimonadaceae bacterium]